MTKRTGHIESGETDKMSDQYYATPPELVEWDIITPASAYESTPLQRLIDSGIVTATDGAITWRIGHLEHVARVYVADPVLAWRDYADDLTVALAADGSTFAAAVEAARGTAE